LIGEKFRAALGIAAPVEVAALAVQPIEFTKRIAAAAKTVNVSFRMGSPIRVILFGLVIPSISLSVFSDNRPSDRFHRNFGFPHDFQIFVASGFELIDSINRHTHG
jgi:hypothetical protein